jgi:hypothetical protein
MTLTQIAADVARGLEIKKQQKALANELKAIEKRLEQAGLEGDQIPLQEEDREGRQFLAASADRIVPVVFESDQIIASFKPDSEIHKAISSLAGQHFPAFYSDSRSFDRLPKDGQTFRRAAREILGTAAPAFISACLQRDKGGIPKSRTVIAWDNARDVG